MRICHVINNLHVGGAEMMLYKLLAAVDRRQFDCRVISLIERGTVGERIAQLGVPVTALGMRRGLPRPHELWRLRQALRDSSADVVQTWMFHADLLGGVAAASLRSPPKVVWNIRHSRLLPGINKRSTFWTAKICARLSRTIPYRVLVNSSAGLEHYAQLGYAKERLLLIPNGFDLSCFRPSISARGNVRRELGIAPEAVIVGHVGRLHPEKDHANLIRAAGFLADQLPAVEFVFCGEGVTNESNELRTLIAETGHPAKFHLLGRRSDIPSLQASFDIAVSSSRSEGFPNVIGEAMACATPCVVTDVGGSAEVVGETGRIVPPQNPQALASACLELLQLPPAEREILGQQACQRIQYKFNITRIAESYCDVWRSAVCGSAPASVRRAA